MSNEYKDWLRDKEEENKYWISKYPFLEMKYDDCYPDDENGCWLDCLPTGWVKAFGKEMCDDLMEALGEYANEWQIIELKEKYAEMRLYHSGVPKDIYDKVESIIDKYSEKSYYTCAQCGAEATQYSRGWMQPFCSLCYRRFKEARYDF